MIHVDRSSVAVPSRLLEPDVDTEKRRARAYFSRPPAQRSQQRFDFRREIWRATMPTLDTLFYGKCAFCETSAEGRTMRFDVEHFRPKREARGFDSLTEADGYWWLAYEWTNLYHSCMVCIKNRETIFPIAGPRAKAGATGAKLLKERALLLDPCADDPLHHPERHLDFQANGHVVGVPDPDAAHYGGRGRGEATIEVFGLNRPDLVKRRAAAANEALRLVRALGASSSQESMLIGAVHRDREFAGSTRQIVARELLSMPRSRRNRPSLRPIFDLLEHELKTELALLGSRAVAAAPLPSLQTGFIQSIEIENFRAIDSIRLEFAEIGEKDAAWKMLLGENGTGKSTVLKAVAYALLGEAGTHALPGFTPAGLLNKRSRAREGVVRVFMSKASEPIEYRFTRDTLTFTSGAEGARVFVRGYGATRLLPPRDKEVESADHDQLQRVDNLFNPHAPLCDAIDWLLALDETGFDSAALTMRDLVHLTVDKPLSRSKGRVLLNTGHGPIPLEEHSDGYQSVLALACDIMAGMPGSLHDKQQARGIVLLDEIDAHLHPRWKMDIVPSLRGCFPYVQFLTSTHEPLCLRGLREREVAILRRDEKRVVVRDDLPSPAPLRVDQLLTSPLFGLYSTVDPTLEARFQRYYQLLAKQTLTQPEKVERDALKAELNQYGMLGYTRRDQMIYEVIDEYLAKENQVETEAKRTSLRAATKKRVAELWRNVRAEGGGRP
jgi:uncharacterized protein (TIGR02646 family)